MKSHNVMDYLLGVFLIASPWVFSMSEIVMAKNLFILAGVTLVTYSALTKYYYSLLRILPLGVHMTLDAALGVFIILAPALLGYQTALTQSQYAAHIVIGVGAIGLVALTRPRTEASKTPAEREAIMHDSLAQE